MKRSLLLIAFVALPLLGADKWWDFYNRGVAAVRAKNYEAGAEALQRSLAEMPNESSSARTRNEIITYVPHFWLGIAKFNLGDVDGALREWRISEDQGVVQTTQYYAQLRDWVARAQSQRQRNAESAAADSKREANMAVGRAVSAQMDAVAAGADRSDRYRSAQRKLQEAMENVAGAGTDIRAYRRASDVAQQALDLFTAAAQDAKQQRASRPKPQPQPQPQPKIVEPPAPQPAPQPVPVVMAPAPEARIEPTPEPITPKVVEPVKEKQIEVPTRTESMRPQLEAAYRAFAAGDLAASEQLLTRVLASRANGEAYLLRGCTRYTRAMLSRKPELEGATADFRAALKLNRALRLDKTAFSPKLVAFFEQVRKQG
jgi:hypothetical protein